MTSISAFFFSADIAGVRTRAAAPAASFSLPEHYTRKRVHDRYPTLEAFLTRWNQADSKQAIIEELREQGVFFEALAEEVGKKQGKTFDPFDLICHVAFDRPALTRTERAEQVKKKDVFAKYGDQARAVLNALLDKYADVGIESIEEALLHKSGTQVARG